MNMQPAEDQNRIMTAIGWVGGIIYSAWLVGLSHNIFEWSPPTLDIKTKKKIYPHVKLGFLVNLRMLRKKDETHAGDTHEEPETQKHAIVSLRCLHAPTEPWLDY